MATEAGVVITARKRGEAAGLRGQAAVVAVGDHQLAAAGQRGQRVLLRAGTDQTRWRTSDRPGRCRSRPAPRPGRWPARARRAARRRARSAAAARARAGDPATSARATRSRTLAMKTSSLRITRPGSSALVEIWSVSTMAHSPYADSSRRGGDPVEDHHVLGGGVAAVGLRLGEPVDRVAERLEEGLCPRLSGARWGISTPRALCGLRLDDRGDLRVVGELVVVLRAGARQSRVTVRSRPGRSDARPSWGLTLPATTARATHPARVHHVAGGDLHPHTGRVR